MVPWLTVPDQQYRHGAARVNSYRQTRVEGQTRHVVAAAEFLTVTAFGVLIKVSSRTTRTGRRYHITPQPQNNHDLQATF
ncbi:hypothetical protein E2C01_079651 [Portunus trituberculatus]|uniref:Uncharacterized protein n=1 Tax=Portunus trituberculatus TaxID=210409 RepID=A0A5B7IRX9_PORTR|nr:hypothetical protein [Portunus trituberculatus]